jgi:hypothetical protein
MAVMKPSLGLSDVERLSAHALRCEINILRCIILVCAQERGLGSENVEPGASIIP